MFLAEGARESFELQKYRMEFLPAGMKSRRLGSELITRKSGLRQSLIGLVCWAKRLESFQKAKGNHLTNRKAAWLYLQFRTITQEVFWRIY